MRIDAKYGSDTGMYLVDVYLESEHECAFGHREIWEKLRPLLASHKVQVDSVLDFFLHRRRPGGEWVSEGLPWGPE